MILERENLRLFALREKHNECIQCMIIRCCKYPCALVAACICKKVGYAIFEIIEDSSTMPGLYLYQGSRGISSSVEKKKNVGSLSILIILEIYYIFFFLKS